jgi:hypothetical protein
MAISKTTPMMSQTTFPLINKGVQMLINRMDSHPEEFTRRKSLNPGRWDWVLEQVVRRVEHHHKNTDNYRLELPFLTRDEVEALYDKWMSIQGDAFTHRIMRELLDSDAEDNDPNSVRYRTQGGFNGMSRDDIYDTFRLLYPPR